MKQYTQIEVIDRTVDSFGTLHVRVFNIINRLHYSVYLDEGEHHLLDTELKMLDEMMVCEYYEPTEGNGVFE